MAKRSTPACLFFYFMQKAFSYLLIYSMVRHCDKVGYAWFLKVFMRTALARKNPAIVFQFPNKLLYFHIPYFSLSTRQKTCKPLKSPLYPHHSAQNIKTSSQKQKVEDKYHDQADDGKTFWKYHYCLRMLSENQSQHSHKNARWSSSQADWSYAWFLCG